MGVIGWVHKPLARLAECSGDTFVCLVSQLARLWEWKSSPPAWLPGNASSSRFRPMQAAQASLAQKASVLLTSPRVASCSSTYSCCDGVNEPGSTAASWQSEERYPLLVQIPQEAASPSRRVARPTPSGGRWCRAAHVWQRRPFLHCRLRLDSGMSSSSPSPACEQMWG